MRYDSGLTRAGRAPAQAVLTWARQTGALVVHTREGHAPDLSLDSPQTSHSGIAGRQTQVWTRTGDGWRIVHAHVPEVPERWA